jgi:hypothetical protein
LVNGFIDHLHTPLGTTSNYSAIANLHTLQITTPDATPFPACCAFNSRSLATASTVEIPQPPALTSFLLGKYPTTELSSTVNYSAISSHPPLQNSTELIAPTVLVITSRHGPHRKHCSSIVMFVFTAARKCTEPLPGNCLRLFAYLAVVA